MALQVIEENRKPTFLEQLGQGFEGFKQAYGESQKKKQMQEQQASLSDLLGLGEEYANLPMEAMLKAAEVAQKGQKTQLIKQLLNQSFTNNQSPSFSEQITEEEGPSGFYENITQRESSPNANEIIPDENIYAMTLLDPNTAKMMQKHNENILRRAERNEDLAYKKFVNERDFQTKKGQKAFEKAEDLRELLPRKEMALDFSRNAVESGDVGAFSINAIADFIGGKTGDALRTSKGAQLITAGKENLLSNMSRVSAKAQNIWFEKRLSSMFPLTGQSKEANLTTQEMLEAESLLDRNFLRAFDEIAAKDERKFGYAKGDVSKRAHNETRKQDKEIMRRASYRMKEIEEKEKGVDKLKKEVGKKVVPGTPFTKQMAILYKKKYGDQAIEKAKKDGYTVPTYEEYKLFIMRPEEYRERIGYE